MLDDGESDDARIWRQAVDELIERGESVAHAMEGATLIVRARRRRRSQDEAREVDMRQSGTIKRPERFNARVARGKAG